MSFPCLNNWHYLLLCWIYLAPVASVLHWNQIIPRFLAGFPGFVTDSHFIMCIYMSKPIGWWLTGLSRAKCWLISLQRCLSSCHSVAAPGEPIALILVNPSQVKDLCCSLSLWQLDTHAAWGHACGAKFELTAADLTLSSPHKDSKEHKVKMIKKAELTMEMIALKSAPSGAYRNEAEQSAVATRLWLDANGIIWCSIIWSWGADTQ